MQLRSIYLLVLATVLIGLASASSIDIGAHSHGVHPHLSPVSLSRGISEITVIHYDPVGALLYQFGLAEYRQGPRYYFGRDFSLGTVDSNYPGTPFLTQFLADP